MADLPLISPTRAQRAWQVLALLVAIGLVTGLLLSAVVGNHGGDRVMPMLDGTSHLNGHSTTTSQTVSPAPRREP